MALVAYASSDEESDHEASRPKAKEALVKEALPAPASQEASHRKGPTQDVSKTPPITSPTTVGPGLLGPQLGPQPAPRDETDLANPLPEPDQDQDQAPGQGHDQTLGQGRDRARRKDQDQDRALIHSLTLPSVPDLSIPPSPPSSPPPLLTSKLQTFLALKRKGTHFNSKLLASASLRNPSLMDKLLAYVDIDDAGQYQTTLAPDLWDANAFPDWAYRDRLRKTREKIAKKKEAERAAGNRTAVEFVPAVNASGSDSARRSGGSHSG